MTQHHEAPGALHANEVRELLALAQAAGLHYHTAIDLDADAGSWALSVSDDDDWVLDDADPRAGDAILAALAWRERDYVACSAAIVEAARILRGLALLKAKDHVH